MKDYQDMTPDEQREWMDAMTEADRRWEERKRCEEEGPMYLYAYPHIGDMMTEDARFARR